MIETVVWVYLAVTVACAVTSAVFAVKTLQIVRTLRRRP